MNTISNVLISSQQTLGIEFMNTAYDICLMCKPKITFGDKSTLVQVMAWCQKPTTHYLI